MTFNFFFYVSLCLFCVFHFFPFGPENLCRYQIPQTFLFNENINLKLSVRSKNCSIFHQNKSKITSNTRKTVALWDKYQFLPNITCSVPTCTISDKFDSLCKTSIFMVRIISYLRRKCREMLGHWEIRNRIHLNVCKKSSWLLSFISFLDL